MYRYALTIEYDGSPFHGWQVQNNITTVQGVIFEAIRKLDVNCENFVGAGRTDAGVHAIGQVAHVDLAIKRDCETIQNAINYFVGDVLGIVQNFQITTSWINKTDKSEYIDKHSHPNSIISGVYYVSTTPKCAPIIFSKPHLYSNITFQNIQLAYSGDNKNQYNTDYYGVNPLPGELLMFPSWLEHYVSPNMSKQKRISISFNIIR